MFRWLKRFESDSSPHPYAVVRRRLDPRHGLDQPMALRWARAYLFIMTTAAACLSWMKSALRT